MNSDVSSAQSGFALRLIQKADEMTGLSPALVTEHMVRKLAHFCEYALLGLLMAATVRIWRGQIKSDFFMVLFFGLLVPVSDEFLQLFVAGRTGLVQDVLLDFSGFIAGMVLYISAGVLSRYCRERMPDKK